MGRRAVRVLESSFEGVGGVQIFRRAWTPEHFDAPEPEPRAIVVLVHGAGEHSGRYEHVAETLTRAGLVVHALDHRGHGRSDGPRALIDRAAHAIADLERLVSLTREEHAAAPLFVLGHSMGAMLTLGWAASHGERAAGLVLSGALAELPDVPAPLALIGRALSALAPTAPLIAIDPELVSRDPAVVAAYRSDPLVHHGRLPARTAAEIEDTVRRLPQTVGAIETPALIMYGTADDLCPPSGSVMVAERIASADVTVRAYEGLFHEILNEPERELVLEDLLGWISARIPARAEA